MRSEIFKNVQSGYLTIQCQWVCIAGQVKKILIRTYSSSCSGSDTADRWDLPSRQGQFSYSPKFNEKMLELGCRTSSKI